MKGYLTSSEEGEASEKYLAAIQWDGVLDAISSLKSPFYFF